MRNDFGTSTSNVGISNIQKAWKNFDNKEFA
jgi:hypothetical protein